MAVPREVVLALLAYLQQRPYREVYEGVAALSECLKGQPVLVP